MSELEQRLERRDDPVHKIREVLERWERRFTVDNPRLMECYLEREPAVLVEFEIDGFLEQSVARFERAHPICRSNEEASHCAQGLSVYRLTKCLSGLPSEGPQVGAKSLPGCRPSKLSEGRGARAGYRAGV